MQSVRLGRLSRKSSETITRSILGDSVDLATIDTIVERADGNAFFIEELSRALIEKRAEKLPDTIAGMVETRIMALPPPQRLALRAASISGANSEWTALRHSFKRRSRIFRQTRYSRISWIGNFSKGAPVSTDWS